MKETEIEESGAGSCSPRVKNGAELPKRVRDKQKSKGDFQWGDEE